MCHISINGTAFTHSRSGKRNHRRDQASFPIEMTDSVDNKNQRKTTLFTGSAFHFLHDGIADGLAVFLPLWQTAFGLSLTQVGLLVTCFDGVTGLFQIPAGFLGERFGERALLVAGTLITTISFACLGFAAGLASLVSLLCIGGLGAAVQHPLASSMVSQAYNANGRRMALGTYNFSGDIGKFLFPALAAVALSHIGWRPVCAGLGLFGCTLTVALFLILRHARVGESDSEKYRKAASKASGWGIVNKGAFSTLSVIGVIDTAVRATVFIFGPFLFIQKGLRPESVGFALSLLFIGGAVGKFVCGAMADRIGYIATVVITECLTGFGILLLTVLPLPHIYFFLPILGAALNGTSSVLYGTIADFVSPHRIARAFGLFYTFVIAAAAVAPPIMGRVSEMMGVGNSIRLIGWIALSTVPMAILLSRQTAELSKDNQPVE
jgi:FSR family fosmidomycin resistance protein-like MFS transporter